MLLNKMMLVLVLVLSSMTVSASGDPTRPPLFSGSKAKTVYPPLQLSMILSDQQNMRAIINESVVGVADTVANAKVLSIAEDSVVLSRAGQRITLRMPIAAVRKERVDE